MLLRISIGLLLGAGVCAGAYAQAPSSKARPGAEAGAPVTETKHLKLTVSASPKTVAPGGRVSLFVDVEPKPKMHVYAPDQKDYISIALTLAADAAVRPQPIRYPPAETYFFEPLKETQRVYSKPFRIEQPVTLAAKGETAEVTIKGTVRYQACDDAICYLPQNVPVSWTIGVKR